MAKYITKLISGETMYYLKDSEARESLGNKVDTTDSRLSDARPASNTVDTYSSTGTDPVSGKAVAAAIGTLDVSSVGGTNKYIKTISETNGKISATAGTVDTSVTADSSNLITSGAVKAAIDALPEPMVFKGSLGTGGTVTSLPTAAAANKGFTYKVITAGTYARQAAKVGDTFISDGSSWVLIPSGDEPGGTVTSVTIKATSPISIDSSAAITSSGTRTISHAASGVTTGTYKSVTVDAKGHVTAGTNPTTLAGYGITNAAVNNVLTNEDLNNVTTPGFYNAGGSNTVTNKPSDVTSFGLEVIHSASGSYYTQIIYSYADAIPWRRSCLNGTWSSWVKDKLTDTNTDERVTQSATTASNYRKVLLHNTAAAAGSDVSSVTGAVYAAKGVEVQPSTGTLKATKFSGDISACTGMTKSLVTTALGYTPPTTNTTYSAGTGLSLSTTTFSLATSGVTAGSYGPSANATPAYGATFNVPYITVDTYGRVTSASTKTVKIPASDNTDTKVTSAANHYAPTADASSELTATISGTAGAYAKDTEYTVLTGVKAQRDAKGHVTGITYTALKIKDTNVFTDANVAQEESTTVLWRKVLLHNQTNTNSGGAVVSATAGVYSAVGVSVQPSTGTLAANKFSGDISGCTGLTSSQIPSLAASKITSGTFAAARIPDLSGTYATSSRASTLEGYFTDGRAKTANQLVCGISYDGGKGVTNPYHLVGEVTVSGTGSRNTTAAFFVDSYYNDARGILVVQGRVDSGSTINSSDTWAKWIVKDPNVNVNNFILTAKATSSSLVCRLYHKITATYRHARFRLIDEGLWASSSRSWQLFNTSSDTAGDHIMSAIPSGETQFVSVDATIFSGATSSADGKAGSVPAPAAGNQAKFLRGDGTWVVPTNTDTKVTSTKTEPTTSATWYALCTTSSDTATGSAVKSPSARFSMLTGTAETAGRSRLELGNAIAIGTAGNMKGSILMYGPTGKYAHIVPHDSDTLHRTIYTPKASGTLVVHTTDTAIGSSKKPVYISAEGVATAIDYTIEANVPSGAKFTDTTYSAGTLALYNTGTDTANRVWSAKVLKSIGGKYLPLAGGTMTGPVDFGNKKMTGVNDIDGIVHLIHYTNSTTPTNDSYACRVSYKNMDNAYLEIVNSTSSRGLRYYDGSKEQSLWMIGKDDGDSLYVGDGAIVTTVRGLSARLLCVDGSTAHYCFLANKQGNACIGEYANRDYTYKLNVIGAVGATGYNNTSDIRKKDIIENVDLNVEDIANAPIFKFLWLDPEMDRGVNVGSSAQYWQTILPEIVSEADDDEKTLSMQYGVAALTSSVTLAKKVVEQEKTIKAQEERIKALEDAILEILSKLNN